MTTHFKAGDEALQVHMGWRADADKIVKIARVTPAGWLVTEDGRTFIPSKYDFLDIGIYDERGGNRRLRPVPTA